MINPIFRIASFNQNHLRDQVYSFSQVLVKYTMCTQWLLQAYMIHIIIEEYWLTWLFTKQTSTTFLFLSTLLFSEGPNEGRMWQEKGGGSRNKPTLSRVGILKSPRTHETGHYQLVKSALIPEAIEDEPPGTGTSASWCTISTGRRTTSRRSLRY